MLVDLNVSVGNFSTSKKSGLLKCVSRCLSPVLIELASIEASTLELVASCSSRCKAPATLVNWPFTFEIIMCLTLNSATEWAASRFQVLAAVCGIASVLIFSLLFAYNPLDALSRSSLQQISCLKKLDARLSAIAQQFS